MPFGAVLGIFAATWPSSPDSHGESVRKPGEMVADGVRPVVLGDLPVRGRETTAENRGELAVGGLALSGQIRVEGGSLQGLRLLSASVLGAHALDVTTSGGANAELLISLSRSIVGDVRAPNPVGGIEIEDSALIGTLEAPESTVTAHGSTVLGTTSVARLSATSSIFADVVTVEEHQEGCVRFSYVPVGSRVPRRFRCQHDLALEAAENDSARAELVRLRVRPRFVSIDPHAPGFLLLHPECPLEIRSAAEDAGEPGCWNHLQHGIRLANLRNALPQFLRFGLETGFFFLV
jgi:hypothetical protein